VNKIRLLYVLLVVLLLVATSLIPAFAIAGGTIQLSKKYNLSSVIIIGHVDSIGEGAAISRREFGKGGGFGEPVDMLLKPCTVTVEAVFKGDGIAPGSKYAFSVLGTEGNTAAWLSVERFAVGERWLFCLYKQDDHLEPLTPLAGENLKIPDDYAIKTEWKNTSDYFRLQALEMLFADLLEKNLSKPIAITLLEMLKPGTITVAAPWQCSRYNSEIANFDAESAHSQPAFLSDMTITTLKTATAVEDDAIKARAAGILCHAGFTDNLPFLVSAVRRIVAKKGPNSLPIGISDIEYIADARALPALNKLLIDPIPAFHAPAAYALRVMADPSSIPYLVQALDDKSQDVRYLSATALAIIAHEPDKFPSVDLYKEKEAELIPYWKSWYQNQKKDNSIGK
jgi:hypothetical protein